VIWSTKYEQSDLESTRRSFQSVRSYEEICGAFDSKSGRHPQKPTSTTLNGDCSASTSGVSLWTAEIEKVMDIATPRRRLKSFEDRSLLRSCEHAQLLAFARLQSLV